MIKPLFQNVLVAVNGSEASLHAAMYGIMMAKQYKLKLKAVFVVDTATLKQLTLSQLFVAEESAGYESNLSTDGNHSLRYIEELAKQKGVKIETELRKGAVWAEIVKAADSFAANLILIGGREDSKVSAGTYSARSAFSISLSEIISNARCSVMVVKNHQIEQLFRLA